MSDELRSMLLAPAGLYIPLIAALILTMVRSQRDVGPAAIRRFVLVFLIAVVCQGGHFVEEYLTGIYYLFPPLFGLEPVSAGAFAGFNILWLVIWVVAAVGVLNGIRPAYFPVWFFALAMCLNGIIHPILSIWTGGYFPGLFTSPVVGIMGVLVTSRLFQVTASNSA